MKDKEKDDLELRLVTTLAPMLFTVAVFALSATAAIPGPPKPMFDALLSILAAFCIFAAALLVDSALDKLSLDVGQRVNFLGKGYLAFCVVNGIMTFIVPFLYVTKEAGLHGPYYHFFPFILAGITVICKMMFNDDKGFWAAAMLIAFFWSLYEAAALIAFV